MIRGAFPPITTRQSFRDSVQIYSDLDGTPFDLTGSRIQVAIAADWPAPSAWPSDGYYDSGFFASRNLLATTDDGTVTIPGLGVFVFNFTSAQIASLCPGIYAIACTLSRSDTTVQLLLGTLPVLDGVVPQ